MSSEVTSIIANSVDLSKSERYAAIIGEQPSKGARSPVLWNSAFAAHEFDAHFHPFDTTEDRLGDLVAALRADPRYLGGAVTAPYKTEIVPLLDQVDPTAERIGAINCVFRNGDKLAGTNTDGEAARETLLKRLGPGGLDGLIVCLLGTGGAGLAVAAFISEDLGRRGRLLLCNRDLPSSMKCATRLAGNIDVIEWPPPPESYSGVDVLINCTSVGFAPDGAAERATELLRSPLSAELEPSRNIAQSIEAVSNLPSSTIIFDIIYQPSETMLLRIAKAHNRRTLNGLDMNLEQAVLAFLRAFPSADATTVRLAMQNAT